LSINIHKTSYSKIGRFSEEGELLYKHDELVHDSTFKEESLPGELGKLT